MDKLEQGEEVGRGSAESLFANYLQVFGCNFSFVGHHFHLSWLWSPDDFRANFVVFCVLHFQLQIAYWHDTCRTVFGTSPPFNPSILGESENY